MGNHAIFHSQFAFIKLVLKTSHQWDAVFGGTAKPSNIYNIMITYQVYIILCIYNIMITYHLVKHLVWFALWDCEYWYVLIHVDFKPQDKKPHKNDETQPKYLWSKDKKPYSRYKKSSTKMLRTLSQKTKHVFISLSMHKAGQWAITLQ